MGITWKWKRRPVRATDERGHRGDHGQGQRVEHWQTIGIKPLYLEAGFSVWQ